MPDAPGTPVVEDDPIAAAARAAADLTPEQVATAEAERDAEVNEQADVQAATAENAPPTNGQSYVRTGGHLAPVVPTQPTQGVVLPAADLDLDETNTITVALGGRVWRAVEPTIATNKILASTLGGGADDEDDAEATMRTLDSIYEQVKHILFDMETGRPPSREFVEEHLTGRQFGKLMERLNSDGGARGNARRG